MEKLIKKKKRKKTETLQATKKLLLKIIMEVF